MIASTHHTPQAAHLNKRNNQVGVAMDVGGAGSLVFLMGLGV